MLTNHDMDSTSPFACLLVGQPTLRRRIKLGVLAALDQRIALRYAMTPMTAEETASYLRHHLTLAGRTDTLFSDDATALIHQTSRGYPRAVNNLAAPSPRRRVRRRQSHRRRVLHPRRRHRGHHRMTTTTRHPDDHGATPTTRPRPAPRRRGLLTSTTSAPSMTPPSASSAAANTEHAAVAQ